MTMTPGARAAQGAFARPDDNEDYDDEDIILDEMEQEWEDNAALADVRRKMNPGWHLIKMPVYSPALMIEVDDWLPENCRGQWKKHGWASGCSYSVALSFSDLADAVLFKLRWCCA